MAHGYKHPRGTRAALQAKAAAGTLVAGQVYLITDEQRLAVALTTTTYVVVASPGVGGGVQGKTTASEVIPLEGAGSSFTPTSAGSVAVALTAATASTVFSIRRGTTQIGTLTYGAGATVGVFNWTGSIVKGDAVNLLCPATPDATLADQHLFFGA